MRNGHIMITPNHYNLQGGILATQTGTLEPVAMFTTIKTHAASRPSHFSRQNINNAATTHSSCEIHKRGGKLSAVTNISCDKVWVALFMTVADLDNWDESTRLSDLVQRLQTTAAGFVFFEIPSEIMCNFSSLVHELKLRFQTVETNKPFRVYFNQRLQPLGESVKDYFAELKDLYDKAYPGRNPGN